MQNISNQDTKEDIFHLYTIHFSIPPGSSSDSQCAVTNWDTHAGVPLMVFSIFAQSWVPAPLSTVDTH